MTTYQQTSREAWESMLPASAHLNRQIMGALSAAACDGRGPITCQEVEAAIERDHQAVSGNLRHLVEDGYVEPSGQHGVTRSGHRAIRWQITPRLACSEALYHGRSA